MDKKKFTIVLFMIIIVLSSGIVYLRNISYSYNDETNNDKSYLIDTLKKSNDVIDALPNLSLSSDIGNDLAGLYKAENKYYFRGYVTNNYVNLANMTWRIISFNDDEVKIVLEEGIDNNKEFLFSDKAYITNYEESNLTKELNTWYNEKLNTLNLNITKIETLEYDEVIESGGSPDTYNESFYLYNGYDTWLATKKEDDLEIESSIIWCLSSDGMVDSAFTEELKTIRPVITINNPVLLDGDGNESSPYFIA